MDGFMPQGVYGHDHKLSTTRLYTVNRSTVIEYLYTKFPGQNHNNSSSRKQLKVPKHLHISYLIIYNHVIV